MFRFSKISFFFWCWEIFILQLIHKKWRDAFVFWKALHHLPLRSGEMLLGMTVEPEEEGSGTQNRRGGLS